MTHLTFTSVQDGTQDEAMMLLVCAGKILNELPKVGENSYRQYGRKETWSVAVATSWLRT